MFLLVVNNFLNTGLYTKNICFPPMIFSARGIPLVFLPGDVTVIALSQFMPYRPIPQYSELKIIRLGILISVSTYNTEVLYNFSAMNTDRIPTYATY